MGYTSKLFLVLMVLLVMSPLVLAHEAEVVHEEPGSELPANLQKINDYRAEQAQFYLKNLSFFIAFLAGMIGILTPCSLAILPAFFAYSFREKKEITKMTLVFFLGFAPVFIIFGLLATFFGKSLAMFQQDNRFLVILAGVLLLILGLMALFGKGFAGMSIGKVKNKNTFGIFLFGVLFALGFTACMAPILAGILLIAGMFQSYLYAAVLMLFYSFGLFVPLFALSMLSDKYNFAKYMNKLNNKLGFSLTNWVSGGLLIILGLTFIIYGGTFITNNLGLGDITFFIYGLQDKIILLKIANVIGAVIMLGFLVLIWNFVRRKNG